MPMELETVLMTAKYDLNVTQRFKLLDFSPISKPFRQKLLSMGLTPGVVLTLIRIAPLGDPIQIEVRGHSISLRKSEFNYLELRPLND